MKRPIQVALATKILWGGILLAVSLAALFIGRYAMSFGDLISAFRNGLTGGNMTPESAVIWHIRLPRVLMAVLVGAGLSAAGLSFQSAFVSPLATPDTVGVAAGASFGASLGILFGFSEVGIQLMSFLFGVLAMAATFWLGRGKKGMQSVVLSGIMIGSFFSALLSLVKFLADTESELPSITYFLMGSLASASFKKIGIGLIPIGIGLTVLFLYRFRMNLLPYEEDDVRALGVSMKRLRLTTLLAATLITSSCVSMCGQVGWIGLIVPHLCRMKWKNNHVTLFPMVLLIGGAFMVFVDTLSRTLTAGEIPVSILTAILGAPFFLYLIRRKGGWKL